MIERVMTKDRSTIALVTELSRGLGKNTALALAKKGVDVVVTYHSKLEEAQTVVSEIKEIGAKAVPLQLDTSNMSDIDSFIERFKQQLQDEWQSQQFDFLVNNAGIGIYYSESPAHKSLRSLSRRCLRSLWLTQQWLAKSTNCFPYRRQMAISCRTERLSASFKFCKHRVHLKSDRGQTQTC